MTKRARLWDGVRDGHPYFEEGHPLEEDGDRRERLLEYLRGGHIVLATRTLLPDRLVDDEQGRVPLIYYTDGDWIWTEEHIYYLENYGMLPESGFADHIDHQGQVPEVDEARLDEAEEAVRGGGSRQ